METHSRRRAALALQAILGFAVSAVAMQGALTALGVNEADMKSRIVSTLTYGNVPVSLAARGFKAAESAMRPKLVQGALAWAKAYTESAAFKADYDKQREAGKPKPPQPKGTVDDELARQKAVRQKSLDEMKKNLERLSPESRKRIEAVVKETEERYAKMDADPKYLESMRKAIEIQRAEEQKSYQERLAAFDKHFPADPNVLIARRLQEFLDASQDVDYSATLLPPDQNGKRRFADRKYEAKPGAWKLCYRAGKESVEVARTFAESWLKAIQPK
jgi:hypothetical protein